jgi:hypothetical protein
VRDHFPDPPPRHVVIGLSGTEFTDMHEFQYASRFLWSAREFRDWLARTPAARLDIEHVEHWLESLVARAWHAYAMRDALRVAVDEILEDFAFETFGTKRPIKQREVRDRAGRFNMLDVLADTGRLPELASVPSLALLLSLDTPVRIPPYSLGDSSGLVRGDDAPLLRTIITELQARGCRVALVETPPSPWLQQRCPEFHGELFRTRLAEFARSLGVPWLPMRPEQSLLGDAAYVDANHLSQIGALRYTQQLTEGLAAQGFFDRE